MSVLGAAERRARARPPVRVPGSRLELWSWYFFRVSGLLLVVLAFGHVAIVHLVNSVDVIDYAFVAARWQAIGWRIYDWLLLALAIVHGQNGLRVLIDDYARGRGWRLVAHAVNWALLGFFLALGTLTIAAFPATPGLPER